MDGKLRLNPYARAERLLRRVTEDDLEQQRAAARVSIARHRRRLTARVLGVMAVALATLLALIVVTDSATVTLLWVGAGLAVCATGAVALAIGDRRLDRRLREAHWSIGVPVADEAFDELVDAAIHLTTVLDEIRHLVGVVSVAKLRRRFNRCESRFDAELHRIRETWVAGDERTWLARCRSAGSLWRLRTRWLLDDLIAHIRTAADDTID